MNAARLTDRVAAALLSSADAAALVEAIVRAVASQHAAGRTHGALSPEVISVTHDGVRWRAALAPGGEGLPSVWRAPEAIEAEARLRPAADVWTLGLLAFWLLTTKHYWLRADGGAWSAAVREEILTSRIEAPAARAEKLGVTTPLPEGFDGWFLRAVSPDASGRFRDAIAALEALPWRAEPVSVAPSPVAAPSAVSPAPAVFSAPVPAPFGAPEAPAPTRRRAAPWVLATAIVLALPAVALWSRRPPPAPVAATASRGRVVSVSAGAGHACAAFEDGSLWCWGANNHHQLGTTAGFQGEPVRAALSGRVTRVAAGEEHTCAVLADGAVECFGKDTAGQLGASSVDASGRVRVPEVDHARGLALAVFHSCALLAEGTVRCWGANAHGQLGDGTADARERPVSPQDQAEIEQLAAGGSDTCAVRRGGTVHCWGTSYGSGPGAGPQEVEGLTDITQVSVGTGDACALHAEGTVSCWSAIRC